MENNTLPLEHFPALQELAVPHGFVGRVPGVALSSDKAVVLANLDEVHRRARLQIGLGEHAFATARQVHGRDIAVIDTPLPADRCYEGCDGLITNQRDVCLGIYVADCCAVYLVDRLRRAAALVHSGKKGSAFGIVPEAIATMREKFGIAASDLIVQLSPCIRPPHYEIDFAAQIVQQCREAGVGEVHDDGTCTACDLARYYSYRAERGRTGRMLALLAL